MPTSGNPYSTKKWVQQLNNGCPGFYCRSFQFVMLPKGPMPCRLHDPHSLYFLFLYFPKCVCVRLCEHFVYHRAFPFLCGFLCWMSCLTARIMMLSKESPWLWLLHICWKGKGKWHRCAYENVFVAQMHAWCLSVLKKLLANQLSRGLHCTRGPISKTLDEACIIKIIGNYF